MVSTLGSDARVMAASIFSATEKGGSKGRGKRG